MKLTSELDHAISNLNSETVQRFGEVIEKPAGNPSVAVEGVQRYWHNVNSLEELGEEGVTGYLEAPRRKFKLAKMERHKNTQEAFIPLKGVSVFMLAPPGEKPDPSEMTPFLMDGSKGILLDEGVWHWVPFPLTEKATFALLLKKETVDEDIEIVEFDSFGQEPLELSF